MKFKEFRKNNTMLIMWGIFSAIIGLDHIIFSNNSAEFIFFVIIFGLGISSCLDIFLNFVKGEDHEN